MQLRYGFRLYPSAGQRMALARAFGCARVVYNDALRARETTRSEGLPSLVVETGPCEVLPKATPEVGIDLGLGHFAVLSDGTKIDSPRFLRRAEKRLKKAQRDLSRKVKGSSNRNKARIRVARAHARVADARREFHHQLSTKLIRENQAVAVEDLAVKGLARTR
ncbi:RNA-guided endonuclease TnpB family protein, partial [Streptomyces sp. NPDC005727]|uniref:RNA-guided endonuclease TnpB family protein n=1 Tax=Streptomyces sp. NPDC005727 TaxID=3157053 RepID=UPI0033D3207C